MEGSYWFQKLVRETARSSPHIRFRRIKGGYYRIYYRNAYIGECSKNMPEMGHDIFERAQGFEDYSYYEEHHGNADAAMRIKNFVEGYWETKNRLKLKLFQFYNDKEFASIAINGYKQLRIK